MSAVIERGRGLRAPKNIWSRSSSRAATLRKEEASRNLLKANETTGSAALQLVRRHSQELCNEENSEYPEEAFGLVSVIRAEHIAAEPVNVCARWPGSASFRTEWTQGNVGMDFFVRQSRKGSHNPPQC